MIKRKHIIITGAVAIVLSLLIILFISLFKTYTNKLIESANLNKATNNISFEKMRFSLHKGVPAIYFDDLLITKKENKKDSIFYSKRILINTGINIRETNSKSKIILISPQVHIYQDSETVADSLPESGDVPDFGKFPDIYAKDLGLILHKSDTIIRIENIHFKIKPDSEKISAEIKSIQENVNLHAGSSFIKEDKNLLFKNSFININEERFLDFNLKISNNGKNISWTAKSDSSDLSALSNDSINYEGIFSLISSGEIRDSLIKSKANLNINANAESSYGRIDSLIVDMQYSFNSVQKDSSTFRLISHLTGDKSWSHILINSNSKKLKINNRTNLFAEDINIWNDKIAGKINSDYSVNVSDKNTSANGESLLDLKLKNSAGKNVNLFYKCADEVRSIKYKLEDKLNYKYEIINLAENIILQEAVKIKADMHQKSMVLPSDNKSSSYNFKGIESEDNFTGLEKLPQINLRWEVDSLISKGQCISSNNKIYFNSCGDFPVMKADLNISGNIKGPVNLSIDFNSDKDFEGKISSAGLSIKDKSKIPLISGNIILKNEAGKIKEFEIPFFYTDSILKIPATSISTKDFILSLSGKAKQEDINFNIALTAPSKNFKGAAKLILNKKEKLKPLETVILELNRNGGEWDIKAEPVKD